MLETFETVSKAVADSSRVRILKLLDGGELCVCQITTVLGLAVNTVSKHLAALKTAGLLQCRRDGKWAYYRLADRQFNPYAQPFLALVGASLKDDPTVVEDQRLLVMVNAVPVQILCDRGRAALGSNVQATETTTCCQGTS